MYERICSAIKEMKEKKGGAIVISGPTGCGKTRCLHRLKAEGYDIEIISTEQLLDKIISAARSNEEDALLRLNLGPSEIVAVEDVDWGLPGRKNTLEVFQRMLLRKEEDGGVVILTGIRLRDRFPALFESLKRVIHSVEIALDE